jgi:hypothetical protein
LDDKFAYPTNSKLKSIYSNKLTKVAVKWDLQLKDKEDLRGAYEWLTSRMAKYNL